MTDEVSIRNRAERDLAQGELELDSRDSTAETSAKTRPPSNSFPGPDFMLSKRTLGARHSRASESHTPGQTNRKSHRSDGRPNAISSTQRPGKITRSRNTCQ